MRTRIPIALLTLLVTVVTAATARADQTPAITADQGLWPSFSLNIHDYVIRCTGQDVVVSVNSPDGTLVSVDHSAMRPGAFSRSVPLTTGQEFSIAVRISGTTDHYYVRCLPQDFPTWTYTAYAPVPPGMFTVDGLGPYTAIFDDDGVPVWWMQTAAGAFDSSVLADGTFGFWAAASATDLIYSLDGHPIRALYAVNGGDDIHELQLLPNGNYIVDSYIQRDHVDLSSHGGPSNASVLDGEVEELTPGNQLVWSWNSGDHLTPNDTPQFWYDQVLPGGPPYDIVHLNSVDVSGNLVVISARHTDAVWGIDRSTGNVLWKLGGTPNPASLSVANDPQGSYPLRGNHDARIQPDGTITLHDNNTGLPSPLRAVHYSIDLQTHTATLLDSLSDPLVPTSFCCGSARRFADGSWLTSWGGTPMIVRYAPDGSRIFAMDVAPNFSYRAIPVPGTTTIGDVRAGMNAQYPRVDNDLPPVAVFGSSPNPVAVGAATSFDAAASYDPDGTVTDYQWDFGDGTSGTGVAPTHVYAHPGDYLVRLTVTDDAGSSDTATRTITALDGTPQVPQALFTASNNSIRPGEGIEFDGSASRAPGGTVVSYSWRFGDGSSATGPITSHVYSTAGDYTVSLTVINDAGLSDTSSATIEVVTGHQKPVASINASTTNAGTGQPIQFDGTASQAPGGAITSYAWNFGDGAGGTGPVVAHAFAHSGSYTVTLTVKTAAGLTDTASLTVTVGDRPPSATVSYGPGKAHRGVPVRFLAAGLDPDGRVVSYAWSFGDGTRGSGASVHHTYRRSGRYGVTVTVTDDSGSTATRTAVIRVR